MSRARLYGGETTRSVSITLSDSQLAKLRRVARMVSLEPAAYLRSLVATHLIKIKDETSK